MTTIESGQAARDRADFVCDTAGHILTIRIRGEIDHHTAVAIRQGIDATLYERRPRKLLLDLSAVSFMDSSGLGLIMGRYSVIRELGGELVVWNPSRETRGILTLAGMERMVKIEYPRSVDETSHSSSPKRPSPSRQRTRTTASASHPDGQTRRRTSPQAGRPTKRKEKDA